MSKIFDFYNQATQSQLGRDTFITVTNYNLEDMESKHDYIQWLFPLREPSEFNPDAPLLTDEDIEAFHTSDKMRERLMLAFYTMLDFYGLEGDDLAALVDTSGETPGVRRIVDDEITPEYNFSERSQVWLTPGNHNFRRLTRMLKSMTLLGLEKNARELLACLKGIYSEYADVIGEETMRYWEQACQEQ